MEVNPLEFIVGLTAKRFCIRLQLKLNHSYSFEPLTLSSCISLLVLCCSSYKNILLFLVCTIVANPFMLSVVELFCPLFLKKKSGFFTSC